MKELQRSIFEASELGWKAGFHETTINILGSIYKLVHTAIDPDGDVIAWEYWNEQRTAVITVLND